MTCRTGYPIGLPALLAVLAATAALKPAPAFAGQAPAVETIAIEAADAFRIEQDPIGPDTVGESVRPGGARLFETLEISIEEGILVPQGSLGNLLDPAVFSGAHITTSYFGDWRAWASMAGAWLDGPESPVAVVLVASATGLEFQRGPAWMPALGAGLALYYVRSPEAEKEEMEYLFLEDGESEFGIQGSARWTLRLGKTLGLHAGARWDLMFTSPRYSRAAGINLGASWTR